MNVNWHSTVVGLNMSHMISDGYSVSEVNGILTHELGHSLKRFQTYCSLVRSDGFIIWDSNETVLTTSIMNPLSITAPDIWRLMQKWQSALDKEESK